VARHRHEAAAGAGAPIPIFRSPLETEVVERRILDPRRPILCFGFQIYVGTVGDSPTKSLEIHSFVSCLLKPTNTIWLFPSPNSVSNVGGGLMAQVR
jgi:hypothetical protein